MKYIRLWLAAAVVVTALVAIPVTLSFGKDIISDAITEARVNVCTNALNACTSQCNTRASSAPGSYSTCMQDCTTQYTRCINGIARETPPRGGLPGVSPRPSIASPKSTAGKTQLERADTRVPTKRIQTTSVATSTATPKPKKK